MSAACGVLEELVAQYDAARKLYVQTWTEWDDLLGDGARLPLTAEEVLQNALFRLEALHRGRLEEWGEVHPALFGQVGRE